MTLDQDLRDDVLQFIHEEGPVGRGEVTDEFTGDVRHCIEDLVFGGPVTYTFDWYLKTEREFEYDDQGN